MNQLIQPKAVNFKDLVKNSKTTLSLNCQSDMIDLLNEEFTEEQSQWYIANLYMYINFDPTTDFPINLDHVFKMIGFANKGNAMKTIKSNFTKDEDYKISLIPKEKSSWGGSGSDEVMLNVDTFKNLCMIVKTPQGKEIRKYYVKLENINNKIIKKEIENTKNLLEQKDQLLIEQKEQLIEQNKLFNELELKPETEGFNSRIAGELYAIKDKSKPGHVKLGIANKSITRVDQLNVGSSNHSLELYTKFETFDRDLAEKLIHHSLHPFRVKNRKEWFYFRNDKELAYAINTIKISLEHIKQFDIKNYNQFKELTENLDVNSELIKPKIIKELQKKEAIKTKQHIEQMKKNVINGVQQSGAQTGTFKGVCFVTEKQLWCAQIQNDNKNHFLGNFTDEIDGAKAYNDYALYLNQTEKTNFALNDIPGYKTVARNVPEENAIDIQNKKSSKYIGVSYDNKRKYYVTGIKCTGKTYNLGSSENELDCAKLYNQQALFFNNEINTTYKLNDIENFVTVPKDIRTELFENKKKKTSKYTGVSLTVAKKWTSSYTLNRKKTQIGTFNTELEACQAYNKTVIELNKNGCKYKVNII
jgi:phage anti-repressor protein